MARREENHHKSNSDWRETLSKLKKEESLRHGDHLREIQAKGRLIPNNWRFTLEDLSEIWMDKT